MTMNTSINGNRVALRTAAARPPKPAAGWLLPGITIAMFGPVSIAQALPTGGHPAPTWTSPEVSRA